jgi:hypothetical protein
VFVVIGAVVRAVRMQCARLPPALRLEKLQRIARKQSGETDAGNQDNATHACDFPPRGIMQSAHRMLQVADARRFS